MPKSLNTQFRETEIKIVSEAAWQNGSPVVEIIKEIFKTQLEEGVNNDENKHRQDQVMQSYNMFFKRVLHLAAQRIMELGEALNLNEDVMEKVWTIQKIQLSTEP